MMDIFSAAQKIIEKKQLSQEIKSVIDNYPDNLRDIVIIFVTDDGYADAFWRKLETSDVVKVMDSVKSGLEYLGLDSLED